ncbi:MAG: polyprenol monophosphomannose synthase [Candidatus Dormibacteraceae bacterium]
MGVDRAAAALVIVPTYDERENLERVVAGVRRVGHDVLVVDDASPDGTGDVADRLAAADGGVAVLHRRAKLGLGSAYVEGFRVGLERGYGLLVEMDADGSHLPEHLNSVIEAARRGGGLAIGSRYVPGGSIEGWGARRWALSYLANLYCRLVLGLDARDVTSGYRCYTRALLERIGLDTVRAQGYSFQIEMAYRCVRLGFPLTEVPIRFEDRVAGRSKVSAGEIHRALLTVVRLRARRPRSS